MTPYQFVLLRYMNNASAGELVNIGVVMWLPRQKRIVFSLNERYGRLSTFFQPFDGSSYRQMVKNLSAHFAAVSRELTESGRSIENIGDLLPLLVRDDASCFQWSQAMGGISAEPEAELQDLVAELVERHEVRSSRQRRDEAEIWSNVEQRLRARGLLQRVQSSVEISSPNYAYKFKTGWQNGVRQVLEPISFDYLSAPDVIEKANTWSGRLLNLGKAADFQMTGVVAPPQRVDLLPVYNQARAILADMPQVRRLLTEDELDLFLPEIERDMAGHQ